MTAHNVSISTTPYAPAALGGGVDPAVLVAAEFRTRYNAMGIRRAVERASTEVEQAVTGMLSLLRECWRRMEFMKRSFEDAELSNGTGPRARSDDRGREEDDSSRMDDEGCPNAGLQPAVNAAESPPCSRDAMEHPLRTLLYEVFVEPILRFLHWPVTKHVEH